MSGGGYSLKVGRSPLTMWVVPAGARSAN